jgi:hypothetical protein
MPEEKKRLGEDYDVIPSLMDALKEALDAKGRKPRHVGYHLESADRTVRRYLDRESFPTGERLDYVVAAAALEAGTNRFALWREAIESAEERIKRLGIDPREEALKAASAPPPPDSD